MPSKWIKTTIGGQLTLQRGFDITKAQQKPGIIPVISSGGISSHHDTAMVKGPGVVLGRKGTVGTVFFVEEDYWPHDTTLWVRDFKGNDRRFVYYFFVSFAKQLASLDVGSANPTLNRNHVHPPPVRWPELEEQHEIAAVLATLDNKIELNRRMNATLEAMAQALFQSWFVAFEPVKAKAAGRAPEGMDADTAALFPSEFQESELGPIPKGWCVGKLGDFCLNYRQNVAPSEIDPDVPYIGLEHMPRKCIALDAWTNASQAESGKSLFTAGDILFGKLRPYFHKVGVAPVNGVCSTDILVVRPVERDWFGVALCHLSSEELIAYADRLSNGAKMPRTKWEDLAKYKVAVPPGKVAATFSEPALVVSAKIQANVLESRRLAELRDALLPKLISGRLRIPDAERLAEVV